MNITPITTRVNLSPEKWHEEIVVVKRDVLFADKPAWQGIEPIDVEFYSHLIFNNKEVMFRGLAEHDISYKQIIPYVVFKYEDTYFLMQRGSKPTETRLADKYTLGIGGHLHKKDFMTASMIEWGKREFDEEINYKGNLSYEVLGMINDDTYDAGKVHAGILICATGDSNAISIKSELIHGTLVNLETCLAHYKKLESWSQHVVTFLENRENGTTSV